MKEFYNKDGAGVLSFYIKNVGGKMAVITFCIVMLLWIIFFILTNYTIMFWMNIEPD